MNPVAQGALIVYNKVLQPLGKKYAKEIEQIHGVLSDVLNKATDPFVPPKESEKNQIKKNVAGDKYKSSENPEVDHNSIELTEKQSDAKEDVVPDKKND